MSKFSFWHWPDHVIYKRESRRLRDEHNAVMNSNARLLAAAILAEELLRKSDVQFRVCNGIDGAGEASAYHSALNALNSAIGHSDS